MLARSKISDPLAQKWEKLLGLIRAKACDAQLWLAFSGGLDSRFLAHAAVLAKIRPRLLSVFGPHIARKDRELAEQWAEQKGLALNIVDLNPLTVPEVAANDPLRCYHCKYALFSCLKEKATGCICDGTHFADLSAHRPGLKALRELGIASPLAEAGLNKEEIRQLAAWSGLDEPWQKAKPCLLTRFAYGLPPAASLLSALEQAEQNLYAYLLSSFPDLPVAELPDFRIRMVRTGEVELHLGLFSEKFQAVMDAKQAGGGKEPEEIEIWVRHAVGQTGLDIKKVLHLDRLSGYFDQPVLADAPKI